MAALGTIAILVVTFVVVAVAAQMFAGIGSRVGLGNEETASNVFGALAISSSATAWTCCCSSPWWLLGPEPADHVHPRGADDARDDSTVPLLALRPPHVRVPSYATLVSGIGTALFYGVMTWVSEDVLIDTIYALGLMIYLYYGLTAFASVRASARSSGAGSATCF